MKSIALCETGAQINGKTEGEKTKDETEMSELLKKPVDGNGWQENSVIMGTTTDILENGECVSESKETSLAVKNELPNGDVKCVKSEPVDVVSDTSLRTEQVVNSVNSADDAKDSKEAAERTTCDSTVVKNERTDDQIENGTESQILEQEINDLPDEAVPKKEENLASDVVETLEESTDTMHEDSPATDKVETVDSVSVSVSAEAEAVADEVFDSEGNKENEELEPDAGNQVFTIDEEDVNEVEEVKESEENDFSIQVGECQSVPIQDEVMSWGELQQEEESKELGECKVSDVKTEDVPTEFKSQVDVKKPDIKEISETEEKTTATDEVYSYGESEEEPKLETEPEVEDELAEDQMEEELVPESQEDEDSALAIQIDEDPITEIKTDEEFASEMASERAANEESSRKRSVCQDPEDSATEIKRRKTVEELGAESVSFVESADEEADDPAAFSNPPTPSEDSNSQVDQEEEPKKRTLDVETDEGENDQKKQKLESDENDSNGEDVPRKKSNLEETIDMVATNTKPLPFLENLRGTLKNLTRSDLEELIVQKLCEVISERSTVGELRRRAQALEQDQEKWKEKVQSLTKQLRESEMVMKKFMSEVQKQNKEKNFQIVTPIRVTRSVGLQVSFLSNAGKMTRVSPQGQNQGMVNISPQQFAKQMAKVPLAKQPLQPNFNVGAQSVRKPAPAPTAVARTILSPQKNIMAVKKPILQKPGTNLAAQNRPIAPQPLVNSNRVLQQNQVQAIRPAFKLATPQQQQQLQLQQQQQQQQQQQHQQQQQPQQTGSRVIDLTDDDDKQAAQKALQASPAMRGQVRVVNHLQQSPVNQNSRVFHLVPATTATTGAGTPNRQIVIAASPIPPQNRQLVSSMPPLIFKGGNFVPAGPQATLVNQNVRPLAPKQFRHPAPLPQPPVAQMHRPNWKMLPPKPTLKISRVQTGIVLSWNMNLGPEYEPIASYQLYAYQESNTPPATSLWKKVGDVKALPLPMACTLTQFMTGHKYHFAVRAVDVHSRLGPFSASNFISL